MAMSKVTRRIMTKFNSMVFSREFRLTISGVPGCVTCEEVFRRKRILMLNAGSFFLTESSGLSSPSRVQAIKMQFVYLSKSGYEGDQDREHTSELQSPA